ncbi:MAG: PrgI family protein [Chloroflexota bacterium]|nr:PrgI family protein [Chloroflexota bacterium]
MAAQRQQAGRLTGARHELPTHLQVEDHLIAGLTVRQTLLLSAGLSVSYSLWRHLAGVQLSIQTALTPAHLAGLAALLALAVRLALAALPAAAFALVALARPADRPLEEWLVIVLRYMTLPKTLIWRSAEATGDHLFDSGKDAAGGAWPVEDDDDDEDDEAGSNHPIGRFAMIGTVPEHGGVRT